MLGNPDLRQYWFDRAEKARVQANRLIDPKCKHRMLALADFYKSMAEQIDRCEWKKHISGRR
jgi:hypothetical protein